jgi:hypothetical protein
MNTTTATTAISAPTTPAMIVLFLFQDMNPYPYWCAMGFSVSR